MTHPQAPAPQTKPSDKGFWIIAVSVLFNCFLIGLVVAPYVSPHHPPPFMPGHFADHLDKTLPPDDAEALRKIYAEEDNVLSSNHQSMDEAMYELGDALSQPEVDPVVLQKALDNVAAEHTKIQNAMSGVIQRASKELSPEGRRIFAHDGLPHPGNMPPPPPYGRRESR